MSFTQYLKEKDLAEMRAPMSWGGGMLLGSAKNSLGKNSNPEKHEDAIKILIKDFEWTYEEVAELLKKNGHPDDYIQELINKYKKESKIMGFLKYLKDAYEKYGTDESWGNDEITDIIDSYDDYIMELLLNNDYDKKEAESQLKIIKSFIGLGLDFRNIDNGKAEFVDKIESLFTLPEEEMLRQQLGKIMINAQVAATKVNPENYI